MSKKGQRNGEKRMKTERTTNAHKQRATAQGKPRGAGHKGHNIYLLFYMEGHTGNPIPPPATILALPGGIATTLCGGWEANFYSWPANTPGYV